MAATPQDIERQLRQIQSLYDKLGESNPFRGVDANAISSSTQEVAKLQAALDGVQNRVNNLDQSFSSLNKQLSATIQEIKKGPDATKRLASGFKGVLDEVKKLAYEEEGINRLNINQLKSLKERAQKRASDAKLAAQELANEYKSQRDALPTLKAKLEFYNQSSDAVKNALIYLRDEDETLQTINDKIDARIKKEKQINENLGISGALLKGAEGLMNKFGLGALSSSIGFSKINEELVEFAEELEKTEPNLSKAEKKQRVMRKGFELMGESIKESLNDPLVVATLSLQGLIKIAGLVADGFKRSQENTSSLAKNLNINNREAMELSKNMSSASFGSDRLFVSSKGLTETLVAINSELGTSVQLTSEELLTFTKLRETAGLTNAELMGIQKLSLANGASFDDNADSILNQVSALNKSSGIYLNEKEVLKDISKLSAATTLSLGKNPKALGEAVATAKSLGMEMAKVDAIAGSLMDFESSITAELEAELLLGRNINLEKARQAALNNDLATLAKEIAEQAGSAEEFGRMNRIQQEAIAKAVGMNREDLAQTLFVQEQLAGASGKEAERRQKLLDARIEEVGLAQAQREIEEGGLQNMLDQATASEKMRASQEKILEIFTSLGAAFAPIVDMFATVVGAITESKVGMAVLAGLITGVSAALATMAIRSVITAVSSIFQGSMLLGPLGIPLAIGGVAALMGGIAAAVSATKAGDVMSPADGKTVVSTKEGGLFELSKNDDLVAAPGAAARMKNGGSTTVVQQASPQDNTETKRTNMLLEKIANTPSVFKIGTDEFFTKTSKYSYQVQ
jgi:hypothetical protein